MIIEFDFYHVDFLFGLYLSLKKNGLYWHVGIGQREAILAVSSAPVWWRTRHSQENVNDKWDIKSSDNLIYQLRSIYQQGWCCFLCIFQSFTQYTSISQWPSVAAATIYGFVKFWKQKPASSPETHFFYLTAAVQYRAPCWGLGSNTSPPKKQMWVIFCHRLRLPCPKASALQAG